MYWLFQSKHRPDTLFEASGDLEQARHAEAFAPYRAEEKHSTPNRGDYCRFPHRMKNKSILAATHLRSPDSCVLPAQWKSLKTLFYYEAAKNPQNLI
jgi:hypothetical protein